MSHSYDEPKKYYEDEAKESKSSTGVRSCRRIAVSIITIRTANSRLDSVHLCLQGLLQISQ